MTYYGVLLEVSGFGNLDSYFDGLSSVARMEGSFLETSLDDTRFLFLFSEDEIAQGFLDRARGFRYVSSGQRRDREG